MRELLADAKSEGYGDCEDEDRAQRRIWQRPPKVSFWGPSSGPNLAYSGQVGTESAFSFDRERPFSFRQDEKKMGVHSVPQSGTFPALRPWPNAFRRYRWSERPAK